MTKLAATTPLLCAFGAMALGVLLGDAMGLPVFIAALMLALALLVVAVALRRQRGVFLAASFAFLALGVAATATCPLPAPIASACADASSLWRVRVAKVLGRVHYFRGDELARRVYLEVLAERCGESWQPRAGLVTARLLDHGVLARGDVLEARLNIEPFELARNPTDPDPLLFARRDGLGGRAFAISPYAFVARGRGLHAWLDRARDAASARFEARLSHNHAALAKALSSGDQSEIDDDMRERWSAAGITHLLSVSGLHITLVATLIFLMLARALALVPGLAERCSARRLAALAAIPCVIVFCLWAGSPAPAVRATVMGVALLLGLALGRSRAVLNSVGLAGILILIAAPASLYDPSFLLSFVAILFLLLTPALPKTAGKLTRVLRNLQGIVLASLVATLATSPITAYYFGRVSLVAPITNLVAVPLGSGLATPLALAYTLVSAFSAALAELLAAPLMLVLEALELIAAYGAKIPLAAIDLPAPSSFELALYYVGLLCLALGFRARRARRLGALAIMLAAIVMTSRLWLEGSTHDLVVTFPYVGQGDATLIRLPNREVMLVDAGGNHDPKAPNPGQRMLAPLLRQRGIRALDLAVVTHPHPDHLNGFSYLGEHFRIGELWWNGEGGELPIMKRLLEVTRRGGGKIATSASLPARIERGGVVIEVLHPRGDLGPEEIPQDPNSLSMVLRLSYGKRSFLLLADIGVEVEAALAKAWSQTSVLKVGHHGSDTSSSPTLLAATKPLLAVISVGHRNTFKLPSAAVLTRYRAASIEILRTDVDGLIELRTDGERLEARTQRGRSFSF